MEFVKKWDEKVTGAQGPYPGGVDEMTGKVTIDEKEEL